MRVFPIAEAYNPGFRRLPDGYINDDWCTIQIAPAGLERIRVEAMSPDLRMEPRSFSILLQRLFSPLDRWVLSYLPYCDSLDEVYALDIAEVTARLFVNASQPGGGEGFLGFAR